MDALGCPESAEPGAAVGDEFIGGHRRVLRQADGGLDTLAVVRAGSGECRRFDDLGVGVKCIVHLPGRDVLASLDDEFLQPAGNMNVAVPVPEAGIAGFQPTIPREGVAGGFCAIEIAQHDFGTLHGEFARVAGSSRVPGPVDDGHLAAEGNARRADLALSRGEHVILAQSPAGGCSTRFRQWHDDSIEVSLRARAAARSGDSSAASGSRPRRFRHSW